MSSLFCVLPFYFSPDDSDEKPTAAFPRLCASDGRKWLSERRVWGRDRSPSRAKLKGKLWRLRYTCMLYIALRLERRKNWKDLLAVPFESQQRLENTANEARWRELCFRTSLEVSLFHDVGKGAGKFCVATKYNKFEDFIGCFMSSSAPNSNLRNGNCCG